MGIEIEDDYNLRGLGRAKAPSGPVFATAQQVGGAVFGPGAPAGGAFPPVPGMPAPVQAAVSVAQNIPAQIAQGFSIKLPDIPGVSSGQIFKVSPRNIPGTDDLMRVIGQDLPPEARHILNKGVETAGKMVWKVAGPPLRDFAAKAFGGGATAGLTAALGAAGSMIPGIGNLVGLAIAGLTAAFKALFKFLDDPDQCEFDPKCPDLSKQIENLTPIEALPLIATVYVETSRRLAEKAYKDKCYLSPKQGKGGKTYKCLLYIENIFIELSEISKNTVNVLGAEQLGRLIPMYQRVLDTTTTQGWTNNENFSRTPKVLRAGKDIGERTGKIRDWTTKEAVAAEAAYINHVQGAKPPKNVDAFSFKETLARMMARHAKLLAMEAVISKYGSTPATALEQIPFGVGEELGLAAEQYVLNPNPETASWLRRVGLWQGAVQGRIREIAFARQEENRRSGRAAIVAKTPAEIQLLQFQCEEAQGRGPKCDELRRLRPGGVPTPPVQSPGAQPPLLPQRPTQTPQQQGALFQLAQARNRYVAQFIKRLNESGNQPARMLMLGVSQQPGLTLANLPEKTYAYVEAQARAGNKAAGMILYAAVKEFQDKVKAA